MMTMMIIMVGTKYNTPISDGGEKKIYIYIHK
jgi:hypothetical protein